MRRQMVYPRDREACVRGARVKFWVSVATLVAHGAVAMPLHVMAAGELQARSVVAPSESAVHVVPNRRAPRVASPPMTLAFPAQVADADITRARVFSEPLVPLGTPTSPVENRELAEALTAYAASGTPEMTGPLDAFLQRFPRSAWRASLWANLGGVLRRTGYFSRALVFWTDAWEASKSATDRQGRQVADRALGDLFELNARLGRYEVLEELFTAIGDRDVIGPATEQLAGARQALWMMRNRPEEAFRCGPLALDQILRTTRTDYQGDARVLGFPSSTRGTSLVQMQQLSGEVGLEMQMAQRVDLEAPLLLPAIVHWKSGHFAAAIREADGRILIKDVTFGEELWVTRTAFHAEASGYLLVPAGPLPNGWRSVTTAEGEEVWGRGLNTGNDSERTRQCDVMSESSCGDGTCSGMPGYRFHLMVASLNLRDTPVGYTPPVGPAPLFTLTYNQRDAYQPQTFPFGNLGPKWTFDWLSYIEDDPANTAAPVGLYMRGGGYETHTAYSASTQSYQPHPADNAIIVRTGTSPIRYERRLNDGSIEIFSQADGLTTFPRRVFMTAWTDPQGNTVSLTYDSSFRIVAATDTIGQVTTISYEHADPLKVTKVTDPFGRMAQFQYDANGRLSQITDVLGLSSALAYGTGDFVASMTTPYGTTRFVKGERDLNRWLEAVDPLGGRERVEYGGWLEDGNGNTIQEEPASEVPTGMATANAKLHESNSFYWDKRAMAVAAGDRGAARQLHWARVSTGQFLASGVIASEKRALERRVWYNYPGQTGAPSIEGSGPKPTAVGRVLDSGVTQLQRAEFNARGRVTRRIDPLGRETTYIYAPNGLDLIDIRQKVGSSSEQVFQATYNAQHQPLTMTDAAGQTTTATYNARGQLLTVTNAKNETTTYTYDAHGYLQTVTGPVAGATTTYGYDGYGRVRTVTDSDAYAVTTDFDLADRTTRKTYPDGTWEQTIYDRLDPVQRRDRLGRWARTTYDAQRRVVSVRDPLGRTITQQWCTCGSLDALLDGKGQKTSWERDVRGRVTREVRADNSTATVYTYEPATGRLKTVTDPKQQVTAYTYNSDDTLQQVTYSNAQVATPSISYTYETAYNRLATMVDGIGVTTYGYRPVGSLGAGELASVDGPLVDDTITYAYDELRRVTVRALNGTANQTTKTYDALGRVTTEQNALGTFTYSYDGVTTRLASVLYPNGQTSAYTYYGNTDDRRLQTIHHKRPGGATLSRFDYTYDVIGDIQSWRQQADSDPAVEWTYGYDAADQLTSAIKWTTEVGPAVLKRYGYAYDLAGNRTAEQIDDVVTGASYDNLNRLTSQQPGGMQLFAGTVNEPATVTVDGRPAAVSTTHRFEASIPIGAGTNVVAITAQDGSGNVRTNHFQVSQSGVGRAFTYDANGNLTSDGTRTFEWDARNQLVAVNVGTHRSEFSYDGQQRRVRIVERESGVMQSDTPVIWCEREICEERAADNTTVTRRAFSLGELVGGGARFFAPDHLRSVGEVTDGASAVLVRYAYDPWGRRLVTLGTDVTTVGYTGHRSHIASDLVLARYRAYDGEFARWLSRDPLGMVDGPNAHAYVGNSPLVRIDPDGRDYLPTGMLNCDPFPYLAFGEKGPGRPGEVLLLPPALPRLPGLSPCTPAPPWWDVDFICTRDGWKKVQGPTVTAFGKTLAPRVTDPPPDWVPPFSCERKRRC